MRRLRTALVAATASAVVLGAAAAPVWARDGGSDHRGSSSPSASAEVSDNAMHDAMDDDAMDDDAMDDDAMDDDAMDDDAMDDDATEVEGLEFETMLTGSSVGGPQIAKANAGGRPWVITTGMAEYEHGMLSVQITGLVIPPGLTNPVPSLAVSVVCGNAIAATSAVVPFSATGDAMVSQALAVPDMCAMPQVLVHPLGNKAVYIAFG